MSILRQTRLVTAQMAQWAADSPRILDAVEHWALRNSVCVCLISAVCTLPPFDPRKTSKTGPWYLEFCHSQCGSGARTGGAGPSFPMPLRPWRSGNFDFLRFFAFLDPRTPSEGSKLPKTGQKGLFWQRKLIFSISARSLQKVSFLTHFFERKSRFS